MKKNLFVLFALSLLFFTGCASSKQVIDPSWVEKPSTVTILIAEPFVINMEDLVDDLPNEIQTFSHWFSGKLSVAFSNLSRVKTNVRVMSEKDFLLEKGTLSNGKNIVVPKAKEAVEAELILCISPIRTSRFRAESVDPISGSTSSSESLRYEASYAYYDGKKSTNLGYGLVDVRSSFTFYMDASNWEENVVQMAENLIKNTPLAK